MRLARVLGPVWGARHAESLDGAKLLSVEPLRLVNGVLVAEPDAVGGAQVAVDALGAGPGELVLIAHGSRVRDLTVGVKVADKDVVVAIVDGWEAIDERAPSGIAPPMAPRR